MNRKRYHGNDTIYEGIEIPNIRAINFTYFNDGSVSGWEIHPDDIKKDETHNKAISKRNKECGVSDGY